MVVWLVALWARVGGPLPGQGIILILHLLTPVEKKCRRIIQVIAEVGNPSARIPGKKGHICHVIKVINTQPSSKLYPSQVLIILKNHDPSCSFI
jgi:hypothetical protein